MIKVKLGIRAFRKLAEQRSCTFKPVGSQPEVRLELADEIFDLRAEFEAINLADLLRKTPKDQMN